MKRCVIEVALFGRFQYSLPIGIQSYSQMMTGVSNHRSETLLVFKSSITILSFGEPGFFRERISEFPFSTAEIVPGLTKKIGRQKLVKGSRGGKFLIYSPPPAQDASKKPA